MGFSPPVSQPAQQAPPKSWIPEEREKPPITVTPDLPKQSAPSAEDDAPASCALPSNSDPKYCAARAQAGGPVSEAFVNAYSTAKSAITAKEFEQGLALGREAESFATRRDAASAALGLQMLAAAELGDLDTLKSVIEKRLALGCLRPPERNMIDGLRRRFEGLK
jgi:hypothetical protein